MKRLNPIRKLYRRFSRWVLDKTIGRPARAPVKMEHRKTGFAVGSRWFRSAYRATEHCRKTKTPFTVIVPLANHNNTKP